ncbi:cation-translocating P-type ATPase [Catenulispora rubra]|uniref:cation-translocating P-type ATPase n=1 Tax=Catenulispora rubra TaxID=280293 RepID=UPI0018924AFB|nr:cation-translocating P-type ATPase [Catenulispora rubra]
MTATATTPVDNQAVPDDNDTAESVDERRPLAELFRDLRTSPKGLSEREAARRRLVYGANELARRGGWRWPRELLDQFTQPLAILLAVAAVLARVGGTSALSIAVVAVILLNAGFAFVQEMQAERAVEALAAFLPATTKVVRDGVRGEIAARDLVPGDVLVVAEGDRVSADARIIDGDVLLDLSSLTGESEPVSRSGQAAAVPGPLLEAHDLVFSGSTCTGGEATAVVARTGMHTELGHIAALSQRVDTERSPLERQVRRATWITLALAGGVRELARQGAVVKRLSAVETLGSTTVICTDKTGTLTENRMRVTKLWLTGAELEATAPVDDPRARALTQAAAACTTADARLKRMSTIDVDGDTAAGHTKGALEAEIARQVGIGGEGGRIVTGQELDRLTDAGLDAVLAEAGEIVFARASPEAKLRICEALRTRGEVVAMTGDGVNDAPALRHADIGVAMGRSGTDVAREAATMVLTDDDFATIVVTVDAGRRVFDNVRKFVDRALLFRAWALLGSVSAALVMAAFFFTLWWAGWHSGDPTGGGTPLHHAYLQATTITFAGIVACQIGTAFAARTDRASLFAVGLRSNPLLLWGLAFELLFTAAVIYAPPLQHVFGTAALSPAQLAVVAPFPVVVWGVDELVRRLRRSRTALTPLPDRLVPAVCT